MATQLCEIDTNQAPNDGPRMKPLAAPAESADQENSTANAEPVLLRSPHPTRTPQLFDLVNSTQIFTADCIRSVAHSAPTSLLSLLFSKGRSLSVSFDSSFFDEPAAKQDSEEALMQGGGSLQANFAKFRQVADTPP